MTVRNYAFVCALLAVASGCEQSIDAPAPDSSQDHVELGRGAHANANSDDLIDKAPLWFEASFNTDVPDDFGKLPASVPLGANNTLYACFLSGVMGDYGSNGWSSIQYIGDGSWRGSGHGRAICANLFNFRLPTNGVRWISSTFSAANGYDGNEWFIPSQSGSGATRLMWQGDAFSSLSGLDGEMEGYKELVRVTQSYTGTGNSSVHADTEAFGPLNYSSLTGKGLSVFMGVPGSGKMVRLVARDNNGLFYYANATNTATLFEVDSEIRGGFIWMAPVALGVCALTKVSGNLNGSEMAFITQVTNPADGRDYWKLSVIAGSGKIRASARCMAFDQT